VDGCLPLAINGSLPKFWDWLSKAKDAGKTDHMDIDVEVWAGRDGVSLASTIVASYIAACGWDLGMRPESHGYVDITCRLEITMKLECPHPNPLGQSTLL
jgi:hypothetical protein